MFVPAFFFAICTVLTTSPVAAIDFSWLPHVGGLFSKKIECSSMEKLCTDRRLCISKDSWCDGSNDCLDGSDEVDCPELDLKGRQSKSNGTVVCDGKTFWCQPQSRCMPGVYRCDGEIDCDDTTDEIGCDSNCSHLPCRHSEVCMLKEWLCDGIADCPHGDDEERCGVMIRSMCPPGQFGCLKDGQCVSAHQVCDGKNDCNDTSDEGAMCNDKFICDEQKCLEGQQCRPSPDKGKRLCLCERGSAPSIDTGECHKLNACGLPGWCEYECNEERGVCECPDDGYILSAQDNRTCSLKNSSQQPILLYGSGYKVSMLKLRSQETVTLSMSISDTKMDAVAFDFITHTAYWSVETSKESGVKRKRSIVNAAATPAVDYVMTGVESISALAWDWVTRSLYLADIGRLHVAACGDGDDGGAVVCAVVVRTHNASPISLAVFPQEAMLFWSQQEGHGRGLIMRSGMDGVGSRVLFSDNLLSVYGMCIDGAARRIYWTNSLNSLIESSRLDGTNRRSVSLLELRAPFSVAVLGGRLYWSDIAVEEIHVCDKFTGKNRSPLIKHSDHRSYHVIAAHSSLQPRMPNRCFDADCSHLCLLSASEPSGYSCFCPEEMELTQNGTTCEQRQSDVILVANMHGVVQMTPKILGAKPGQLIERIKPQMLTALTVAYLPVRKESNHSAASGLGDSTSASVADDASINTALETVLIYADSSLQRIVSCLVDGSRCRTLVKNHMGLVTAVVVDAARSLIYWCDSRQGSVQVASHDGLFRRTIASGLRFLVHMTTAEEYGLLLVAVGGTNSAIYAVPMNGGRKWPLVTRRMEAVSSLHFDRNAGHLYWTEIYNGLIGRVRLSKNSVGSETSSVVTAVDFTYFKMYLMGPFSVSVLDTEVFWVDTSSRMLHWTNSSGESPTFQQPINLYDDNSQQLLRIATGGLRQLAFAENLAKMSGCQKLGCSQLCLTTDGLHEECACSDGFQLEEDSRTCSPINCSESNSPSAGKFSCDDGKCIAASWRCDSVVDCAHGEDETGCTGTSSTDARPVNCSDQEFMCSSQRQCVSRDVVCNAVEDCFDGSDEGNCSASTCKVDQFRCGTGACIDLKFRCNQIVDCADISDESHCGTSVSCQNQGMFSCNSGLCLKSDWFCDGHPDCPDYSDEPPDCQRNITISSSCPAGSRRCNQDSAVALCIDDSLWCDCSSDCVRAEDETVEQCGSNHKTRCSLLHSTDRTGDSGGNQCVANQYRCDNGSCIAQEQVCDRVPQCSNGEDEVDCLFVTCPGTSFKVMVQWICDGERDCSDGWDESSEQCDWSTTASSSLASPRLPPLNCSGPTRHLCADGWQCVERNLFCDGSVDCDDLSDEGGLCSSACGANTCDHKCQPTPTGPVCECPDGYRVDGKSCVDVDECNQKWPPCSHTCRNIPGSFRCGCLPGYWPEGDGRTCRAPSPPRLLLSVGRRLLSRATETLDYDKSVQLVFRRDGVVPVLVAFDVWTQRLIFEDRAAGRVVIMDANSTDTRVIADTNKMAALTYDWQTKNVYVAEEFTDTVTSNNMDISSVGTRLRVCSEFGDCHTIYRRTGETWTAMKVVPEHATVYACGQRLQSGRSSASSGFLLSVGAGGGRRRILLQHKISSCGGIDTDLLTGRIWLSDHYFNRLTSVLFDGSDAIYLQSADMALFRPTSVAVFNQWVYVVEHSTAVLRCHTRLGLDKSGDEQVPLPSLARPLCQLVHNSSMPILSMTLQHQLRQPQHAASNISSVSICQQQTRCAFLCVPELPDSVVNVPSLRSGKSLTPLLVCRCPDSQPNCQLTRPPLQDMPSTAGGDSRSQSSTSTRTISLVAILCVVSLVLAVLWLIHVRREGSATFCPSPSGIFRSRITTRRRQHVQAGAGAAHGKNGTLSSESGAASSGRRFHNPVYGVNPASGLAANPRVGRMYPSMSNNCGDMNQSSAANSVLHGETGDCAAIVDNAAVVDVSLTDKLVV